MSIFKPSSDAFCQDFFAEPGSNPIIVESDAGQEAINKIIEEERIKEKERINNLKEEYNIFYKHLSRNDKCACGSGKKYKNCCINKFNTIK